MTTLYCPPVPILLIDDEKTWYQTFSFFLEYSAGINNVVHCEDGRKALDMLGERRFSLILLDLNMTHISGEELLPLLREAHPDIPVIVITGMNQVQSAVRCLKLGAFNYFVKTDELENVLACIRNALSLQNLRKEITGLKIRLSEEASSAKFPEAFSQILTCSPKLFAIFRYLEAIACGREPVLITGESGVGKELFARAVHRLSRPGEPLVTINVAGLDDHVFSDSLFGHVKGAFTGADRLRQGMVEKAGKGTLFLDEIGDLSSASQVKLLRLVQEGDFFPVGSDQTRRMRARIVCATNKPLQCLENFRKDLFFRLQTHHIHIPPLRERKKDIPLLLDHFLTQAAKEFNREKPSVPEQEKELLLSYSFPGNVRELRSMVYDAVGSLKGAKLLFSAFRGARGKKPGIALSKSDSGTERPLQTFGANLPTLEESAHMLIEEAMRRSGGNQTVAASTLGISQPALSKRLKKLKLNGF